MRQNKIFKKLFLMIVSFAFVILFIQFVFQYFWLDDFYLYTKKQESESALTRIESMINNSGFDDEVEITEIIESYVVKEDIYISTFDRYGNQYFGLQAGVPIYLTMLSDSQEVYQVYLEDYSQVEGIFDKLIKGKNIRVKGYITPGYNEIFPEWITVDGKDYGVPVENIDLSTGLFEIEEASVVDETTDAMLLPEILIGNTVLKEDVVFDAIGDQEILAKSIYIDDSPQVIKGQISFTNLDRLKMAGIEYKEAKLMDEQFRIIANDKSITDALNTKGYTSYQRVDAYTGMKNLVAIKKFDTVYGESLYIMGVSSLQSVDQMTDVTLSYFYMTVLIAFMLAIVFSYFYSKKITKPLLHLNEVTAKLAEVDFSSKCQVHSNDEIEDLAHSINQMSDKLENTLKQLKRFLADASHELKTPLTVMKGTVEGLMDGVYDKEDPTHYKRMQTEINEMSQLVYDLLELSKLEAGETELREEVFQLSDLVLKTHGKLGVLVKEKNLSVTLDLNEFFVKGHEGHIETVVRNFYTNAIRYTPEGGSIKIRMFEKLGDCHLEIENSPSHIDYVAMEKLWQPFFRVEESRNKQLGGTGLGLYMVKEILIRHESAFDIVNTQDGVCAFFTLKIIEDIY